MGAECRDLILTSEEAARWKIKKEVHYEQKMFYCIIEAAVTHQVSEKNIKEEEKLIYFHLHYCTLWKNGEEE